MKASAAFSNSLMEHIPGAICVFDFKGIVQHWNNKFLGYAAAEMLGQSILKTIAPESICNVEETMKRVFAEGDGEGEAILLTKDGRRIPFYLKGVQITFQGKPCVLGIAIDISKRKTAEDLARIQTAALKSAANGIVITDAQGTIQWVNPAFTRLTGYSPEEVIGKNPSFLRSGVNGGTFHDDPWTAVLAGNAWSGEVTNRRKGGEFYTEEMTLSPVRSATGEITNFVAIKQDVSERKRDIANRRKAEEALHQSELHYRLLFDTNPVPMWVFDKKTLRFLAVNEAAVRAYGFSREEFLSMTIADIRPTEDVDALLAHLAQRDGGLQKPEFWRHLKKDGTVIDVEVVASEISFYGVEAEIVAARDVTERRRSEEKVRQAEEKYRAIFENSVIGIFQTRPDGRPISINPALAQMHGYDSPEQLMAEVPNVSQLFVNSSVRPEIQEELARGRSVHGAQVEVFRRDGTTKWVQVNMRAVRDANGEIMFSEGTVEDITERRSAEERVQYLAYYDALTGLPNRTLLKDRMGKAFASARRRKEKVALLFLDLDRFKYINDSLGHSLGDTLLQQVAERLKGWVREQDTVARLGGDEFLVVVTALNDTTGAAVSAERLMDAMLPEFVIQGHSVSIRCSVGISVFPDNGEDEETLIKNADLAMYSAKDEGRNNYRFFSQDMNVKVLEHMILENNLRQALDHDEFFLVYQPQVDLETGKLVGLEALLRWKHPQMGLVPPDKFIRIAENDGLIVPIGHWVLKTACAQVHTWQQQGLLTVPVSVNVSAVQFRHERFLEMIRSVLQETRLAPEYLELELTESLLASNVDVMISVMRQLKEMGVKLSIDDFGTGYSSLSYLKQFPVSKLKIDRSFVQHAALNPDDAAITSAIISLAKSLNLRVIAEGVETEEQMRFLRLHRCDEVQGYYFSKPLPADNMTAKLQSALLKAFDTTVPDATEQHGLGIS